MPWVHALSGVECTDAICLSEYRDSHRLEEIPSMPRDTGETQDENLVRCAYAERNCLRRDRDGNVPYYDESGQRQVEQCSECGEWFCIIHRHMRQRHQENYCESHGGFRPRCVLTTECESCGHRFCEECEHEPDSYQCERFRGEPEPEFEPDPYGRTGHYQGPWRIAELAFNGNTPVPGLATGERYIAFELEEEVRSGGSGQFTLPERFGITLDGSLRNGVEVTLPPSRMDALVANVNTAVSAMQAGGYAPTERCGMHTHIDLRDKVNDNRFLSHLFATFYAIEDVLFAMQSPTRVRNSYCVPLRNGWRFYDTYGQKASDFDFVFYKMPKSLANKMRIEEQKKYKGGNRYNAFNFSSVWYRGSLEVRLHEGCLDARRMLLWAELLQFIVARVEKGITYPTLRKLVEMDVSPEKLTLFGRVFQLPDHLLRYVQGRIMESQGSIHFRMPQRISLGTPVKGRAKSLLPRRTFRATHRRCRWCSAIITLNGRCRYCRRQPLIEGRDEYGFTDQPGMHLRSRDEYGSPSNQFITQADFEQLAGVVTSPPPTTFPAESDEIEF